MSEQNVTRNTIKVLRDVSEILGEILQTKRNWLIRVANEASRSAPIQANFARGEIEGLNRAIKIVDDAVNELENENEPSPLDYGSDPHDIGSMF